MDVQVYHELKQPPADSEYSSNRFLSCIVVQQNDEVLPVFSLAGVSVRVSCSVLMLLIGWHLTCEKPTVISRSSLSLTCPTWTLSENKGQLNRKLKLVVILDY